MHSKTVLAQTAATFQVQRPNLHDFISRSPIFTAASVPLYSFDTLGNLEIILKLVEKADAIDFFVNNGIRTILDAAGANGDISFIFSLSGFQTTYVDMTLPWAAGPLVASLSNLRVGANVRVVDFDLDRHFQYSDLTANTVNAGQFKHQDYGTIFDLVVCTGFLYHLKNPFAFLESLSKLCRFCIRGTWCMSHLPDNVTKVRDAPVAYLLDAERANDGSNYWIFTHTAYNRLVTTAGFVNLASVNEFLRDDRISNATDLDYWEKE